MKKFNQKGFSAIEGVLIVVIIAIVGFVVWYVFHTKNTTNNIYGNTANTQTAPPQTTKKSTTATTTPVVQTKTDSSGTKYLADASGKTLYTYGSDTANTSNCSGSCLANWPAYKATSSSASLPANVGTITRSDGSIQYTYKKMPLYYYTGDTAPGQINGNGVEGFSLAKP